MEMKLARASARTGSMAGRLNLFEANVMTLERRGDQVFAVAEAVALHTGGRDQWVIEPVVEHAWHGSVRRRVPHHRAVADRINRALPHTPDLAALRGPATTAHGMKPRNSGSRPRAAILKATNPKNSAAAPAFLAATRSASACLDLWSGRKSHSLARSLRQHVRRPGPTSHRVVSLPTDRYGRGGTSSPIKHAATRRRSVVVTPENDHSSSS